jgi:flagellar basal body-associated protein FliL
MNYNQNFNNPQQNWNQPPAPEPRKPQSPVKWIIISLAIVLALGGLFYLVASLGKKMGSKVGEMTNGIAQREDSLRDEAIAQEYVSLVDEIQMKQTLPDSVKTNLINGLNELKTNAANANDLLKQYASGFNDTMQGRSALAGLNKIYAHNYFIKTGRATNLKNALIKLRDEGFAFFPSAHKDSTLLDAITVYDNERNMPAYLSQLAGWEALHFYQPAITVRLNITLYKKQIRNYASSVQRECRYYLETYP